MQFEKAIIFHYLKFELWPFTKWCLRFWERKLHFIWWILPEGSNKSNFLFCFFIQAKSLKYYIFFPLSPLYQSLSSFNLSPSPPLSPIYQSLSLSLLLSTFLSSFSCLSDKFYLRTSGRGSWNSLEQARKKSFCLSVMHWRGINREGKRS